MAVVAAFELHDLAAARVAAREPQRRHRRLGARGHEAHHLHRRQQAAERLGHLDLELGRRAERQAVRARLPAPRAPLPGARGRGSPAPTSRRSRCSACRRRPTGTRPRRASKKRGVPPTERKARTGELTPAGIVRCARANSSSLRLIAMLAVLAEVDARSRRRPARAARAAARRRRRRVEHRRDHGERVGAGADSARALSGVMPPIATTGTPSAARAVQQRRRRRAARRA